MTNTFDTASALAELAEDMPAFPNQPRLSFPERCGVFCALYARTPHAIVARAFGITKTTVSLIGGCLPEGLDHREQVTYEKPAERTPVYLTVNGKRERQPDDFHPSEMVQATRDLDPNKNRDPKRRSRYQDIAHEFVRLGRDEFMRRYYTEEIHTRVMKAKYLSSTEDLGRSLAGANPAAAKFAFKNYGVVSLHDATGEIHHHRIAWFQKGRLEFEGWHWSECAEDGSKLGEWMWRFFIDHDKDEARAFRTSAEAFDAIYSELGLESPRPKPGRPKSRK